MAQARQFERAALVIGILSSAEGRREEMLSKLKERFGEIKMLSPTLDFPYTDYYDKEMGGHPVRYLVMFESLVDPSELADFKTFTNELEKQFLGENGRMINIDPGLLTLSNFVLATCKDRSHRIALRNGVYAEVTMIYQDKDFQRLPWTYSDYGSDEIRAILRQFREEYKRILTHKC